MAISRRTTKGPAKPAEPASSPVNPQARRPARATPAPAQAPSDQFESGEQEVISASAPEPAQQPVLSNRRSTPGGKGIRGGSSTQNRRYTPAAGTETEGGSPTPPTKKHRSAGGEAQIGQIARRGMSLRGKLIIFTLLVALPISVIFAMVSIRELERSVVDEIKRSGYNQLLALNGLGQTVIARLKNIPDKGRPDRMLDTRNLGELGTALAEYAKISAADKAVLDRVVKGDARLKDVAIFVSSTPTDNPSQPVLRGDPKAESFSSPTGNLSVPVAERDGDVQVYWGRYGGEDCLYFRMPLEKSGDKWYSSMSLIMSAGQISAQLNSFKMQLILFGLVLIGLGLGASWGVASWFSRPINVLVEDIDEVSQGNLDHESDVPNQTSDEVGLLAMAFNRMTRNLRDAREKERDRERLEGELNTAKAIHAKLMPEKLPQLPNIDVFTAYNCAKEVGGDYYDFIPVGDTEHLALCVADVSGKGIPGSMVMGTTRTILRMMAVNNLSAADVLSKTNFHVARDIKRGMFVTCMYAILNVRTKEMTVASAGHNPMLIWRAATKQIEKVRPNGIALGFDKGPVFNRTVKEQKVQLYAGDRVVLYTDGVVESMNEQRQEWSDEALDEFTIKNATLPSKEYVRLLLKALEEHQGRAEQHDDITITTFRIV